MWGDDGGTALIRRFPGIPFANSGKASSAAIATGPHNR